MFPTVPSTNFNFSAFDLSFANAFNLDQSKHLLFGKELRAFSPFLPLPHFSKAFGNKCIKRCLTTGENEQMVIYKFAAYSFGKHCRKGTSKHLFYHNVSSYASTFFLTFHNSNVSYAYSSYSRNSK